MGLLEVIAAKGLFSSLYTDRGSHYFLTPKAGGKVDRVHLTQVGRALAELKIERTSRPTARKHAVAWSGCSAPCSSGCRRCCGCTASRRSRRPTSICGRSTSQSTTAALRSPRPKRGAPSCRSLARCARSCAFAMSASCARDLPWPATAGRLPSGRRLDRGGRGHAISRLSPLGGYPVDLWITLGVAHNPTGPIATAADI